MRKSRRFSRLVSLGIWLLLAETGHSLAAMGHLPFFFSDNHAETMAWITETFDLEKEHVLVLVDAHSDASCVTRSDEVREGLRRVSSVAERTERVRRWRDTGRIQAFGWVEPLMPAPISEVVWVRGESADSTEKAACLEDAAGQVDNRLEFEARRAGTLGPRWKVEDIREFEERPDPALPVILTIDLDFFAGMEPEKAEADFARIWERAMKFSQLEGVSFSISRPWLGSDEEAYRLFAMALEVVRRLRGAEIRIEPFVPYGADDSLKGREYRERGSQRPEFRIEQVPAGLKAALLNEGGRIEVRTEAPRWQQLLEAWQEDAESFEIVAEDAEASTEGIYRIERDRLPDLRIRNARNTDRAIGKVHWRILKPTAEAFNLWPDDLGGKAFSHEASPWVRETPVEIAVTDDPALSAATWAKELDPTGWGRLRIEAEIESEGSRIRVPAIEIRVGEGTGFRRALREQFGMSYVFGIGVVEFQGNTGPETGWGSDCANFGIAAWRKTGRSLRWGDPVQLRSQLSSLGEKVTVDSGLRIEPGEIEAGVAIIFGRHAAFLLEDRPPIGVLDGEDLVAHHLGKRPEAACLADLATHGPSFSVRTVPKPAVACRVAIAGDVVLRDGAASLDAASLRDLLNADLAVANLEGLPADGPRPVSKKRYDFSFPSSEIGRLREMSIDVAGFANNHAEDIGDAGILPAKKLLERSGILVCGVGATTEDAVTPVRVECKGVPLALFSVSAVETQSALIAKLPECAEPLLRAIREARSEGRAVIVLVHWGTEYSRKIDEDQRYWARWLVEAGANVVAGSHPHVVQMVDRFRGACVAYSLGNAVYPKSLSAMASSAILKLEFDQNADLLSANLDSGY